MTQITYHPAFDPYHQIFRTVRLIAAIEGQFDGDKLRVADFYLLFPERIQDIRLSRPLRSALARLKPQPRFPYDRMPDTRVLFARMEHTFQAAVQTMLHYELLDPAAAAQENVLSFGPAKMEFEALLERARAANAEEPALMSFLESLIEAFPYHGADGLKDRTGLEEHRYDAA